MAERDLISRASTPTVGNSTATNQAATAANVAATATNDSTLATNTPLLLNFEVDKRPAAPGTNYIAQFAAGAPLNSAGPFAQFIPMRAVQIELGAAGVNPVSFTVTGTNPHGAADTDVIVATGPGTYQGTKALDVTLITSDVDPGDVVDLQTGNGFNPGKFSGLAAGAIDSKIGVNGVSETATVASAATGTVVPATAPDGSRVYTVRFNTSQTPVQNPHTHTQAAHNHTQTAHNHTQDAHNHTV